MVQMAAEATADSISQHALKDKAWKARQDREKKRHPAPIHPLAGMDAAVEVPPMDDREWCIPCLLVKAFNRDENDRVRTAEEALNAGTSVQQWIDGGNPLSYDEQHLPVVTPRDPFHRSSADRQHIFQEPLGGPHTYSMDALTNSRWDLLTHTAFHTWPHHDGSGMSTWITIRSGCKVWAPLIPILPKKNFLTQQDLLASLRNVLKTAPSTAFQKHSQSLCMFLLPNDVLQVLSFFICCLC